MRAKVVFVSWPQRSRSQRDIELCGVAGDGADGGGASQTKGFSEQRKYSCRELSVNVSPTYNYRQ